MPGLIIDKVGGGSNGFSNPNIHREATYEELNELRVANKLIIGQKYLMLDYLHKYLIGGSDTGGVVNEDTVSSTPYAYYSMLESGTWLVSGTVLTVTSLPGWYTGGLKIGDTGTVNGVWSGPTYTFSGIPPIVGLGLSYSFPYYNNEYISEKTIKERFNSDLTGTIDSISDTNIITGTGTLFTTELQVGETIKYMVDAGYGYDRLVIEIVSDTELITDQNVLLDDIATNVAFEKITFGRDIMRPGGIVNTEVHNGEAYSGMTAEENYAPQTEALILTAISPNSFSTKAESATYIGDVVEYNIDNKSIVSRSGAELDTRNGLIIHRENRELQISLNHDWRAQRFRRFALLEDQMTRLKNISDVYKLDSGSQVYHMGGINSKSSNKDHNKYLMRDVESGFGFTDFTIDGQEDNVFENGYKLSQTIEESGAWEGTITAGVNSGLDIGGFATEFYDYMSLNFNEIKCNDFPILPLVDYQPSKRVKKIKVNDLQNTIFLDKNRGMGVSVDIDIEADILIESTFMTGGKIFSTGYIERLISIENFDITNTGSIHYVINFAELSLNNAGQVQYCQFGGAHYYAINFIGYSAYAIGVGSKISSSIFGVGNSSMQGTNIISDTICKDILLKYMTFASNKMSIMGSFFCLANHEDAAYGGNVWFQRSASTANNFDLDIGFQKSTGELFWLEGAITGKHIKIDKKTKTLFNQEIIDGQIVLTEISKATKSVNLAISMLVDDLAPIVGNNVLFTITTSNNLGNAATNVQATSLLPAGYTYVSDDVAGNYDPITGIWNVGDLAISASDIINIIATVEAAGPYQVDASVSSDELESAPEDNAVSTTTTPVAAINDLDATIVVDNAAPTIGNNVVFTISGFNNGNKLATNVQATSLLPDGYTYVSDDVAGNYDPITGIWNVGNLSPGTGDALNVIATVEAAGSYTVDVSITGSELEDLPADNTDTVTPVPVV
jgi:uncharacterized repeat protein (TIGR01451 family)